jgi:hypothetical protein
LRATTIVKQKKLKVVLEKFEPPPRPISVIYPHARLLPARVHRLMKKEL